MGHPPFDSAIVAQWSQKRKLLFAAMESLDNKKNKSENMSYILDKTKEISYNPDKSKPKEKMIMLWMTTILSVFPQIMLVLALYYIVWRSQTMSKDKTGEYDERQMQNRGRAFRAGFLICAISNIFGGVGILVEEWLQPYGAALLVGSAFLGLTVFAVIAIWTDAFLTSARNPRYYLTLAVIIVLGNGFALFAHPDWNTAKELLNSVHLLNLCCMVTFLVVGITLIVKLFLERREA